MKTQQKCYMKKIEYGTLHSIYIYIPNSYASNFNKKFRLGSQCKIMTQVFFSYLRIFSQLVGSTSFEYTTFVQ